MNSSLAGALLILAGWAAFGTFHSLFARVAVKRLFERAFGRPALAGLYRPAYTLFALATVTALWLLPYGLLGDVPLLSLPGPLRPLPYLLKGAALAVIVAGFRRLNFSAFLGLAQLGNWLQGKYQEEGDRPAEGFPLVQEPEPLSCEGPFLWVRHPINAGAMLWVWSQPTYTLFDLAFALGLTFYVVLGVRLEEKDLLTRYGAAYARYQRVVPAFLGLPFGLRARKRALEGP